MTIDESFRATLHVLGAMQIDVLRFLQAGTMSYTDVQRMLAHFAIVQREVELKQMSAARCPGTTCAIRCAWPDRK